MFFLIATYPPVENRHIRADLFKIDYVKIHFQTISHNLVLDQTLRALFEISKMKQELTKDRDISYYIHHVCFEVQL